MKNTIWKYSLKQTETQVLNLPKGAEVLSLKLIDDELFMWAVVQPDEELEERTFITYGTGNPLDEVLRENKIYDFVGTYVTTGEYVGHVFELIDNPSTESDDIPYIKDNEIYSLNKDIECLQDYLDFFDIPIGDEKGTYSVTGRVNALRMQLLKEISELELELFTAKSKTNLDELEKMLCKYQRYVSNIEWHIQTNNPKGAYLDECIYKLSTIKEIVNDLNKIKTGLESK